MNHAFERLTRIGAAAVRARLLLAFMLCLLTSAYISAQSGFTITSPTQGSLVVAEQPVTVTWTGGNQSDTVNVFLISYVMNAVVDTFGSVPNSGSQVVTIGERFCGTRVAFYVQNTQRTMWTYGPEFSVICRIPVAIDIKPGSFPNSVNLGSEGTIPVAILGSATLNVGEINVRTLMLGTAGVKTVGKTDKFMCSVSDVSGDFTRGLEGAPDGFLDLVCHFVTVNMVPEQGGTSAKVMGDFIGGGGFEGTDSVNIVP